LQKGWNDLQFIFSVFIFYMSKVETTDRVTIYIMISYSE